MASATARAEIALTTAPLTRPGAPDWTAITAHTGGLRSLKTQRGADIATGDIETGTASCVVDNSSRALDPENTGSPWYPNVKFNRRIRFYIDPPGAGAEQLVFTGFIDHLPTRWTYNDGWVELTAVDLFSLIAGQVLPQSVLQVETEAAGPDNYWPLSETIGTNAEDVVGAIDGAYAYDVTLGRAAEQLSPWVDGGQQWQSTNVTQRLSQQVTFSPWIPVDDWTVGMAVRVTKTYSAAASGNVQDGRFWFYQSAASAADFIAISVDLQPSDTIGGIHIDYGLVSVYVTKGGNVRQWQSATSIADGLPHYIAFTMDHSGSSAHLYIDGVDETTLITTGGTFPAVDVAGTASIGLAVDPDLFSFLDTTETTAYLIGHVAYWHRVITPVEAATLAAACLNAWDGDTTGDRAARILDVLGVDSGDRDLATGSQFCGPTYLNGQNALAYLKKIAATEGGAMFVSPDGKITLLEAIANNPTPVAVISDNQAVDAGSSPYRTVHPDYSPLSVINQAAVTREGGIQQRASNQTSIDAYGVRGPATPLDTLLRTASATRSRAGQIVARSKDPSTVIDSVEVLGERSDTSNTLTLATELQDAVTLIVRPTGGGSAFSQLSVIQQVGHQVDPHSPWVTTFGLTRHVVLLAFQWDGSTGHGWDESQWP